jgi:hypothetical protein
VNQERHRDHSPHTCLPAVGNLVLLPPVRSGPIMTVTDHKIDALVYKQHGLTEEESAVVEES